MPKVTRGGRRAENVDEMNVPYDKWGEEIQNKLIRDSEGTVIGYIQDQIRFDYEPDIRKITKKDAMDDIEAWKNDDGTYGTGDEAIYVFYEKGMVNVTELEEGQKFKKSGIIGISISTGDYEIVWGNERNSRTGKLEPITTWTESGEGGKSNVYSGYKAVSEYRVRVRETSVPEKTANGSVRYRRKREIIRKSTKKSI